MDEIVRLCKKFRVVSVTFDHMFSLSQRNKLRENRINHKLISFAGRSKNEIYQTFKDLLIQGRVELCSDDIPLQDELLSVVVDYGRTPPRIGKDINGLRSTDDLVDGACGVCHSIMSGATGVTRLPRGVLVDLGRR